MCVCLTDDAKYAQFYRHWSMKEAYIKAVGIGKLNALSVARCLASSFTPDRLILIVSAQAWASS